MGWLSALAKIGGVAAAPFTGGMSLIPTALGAVGDVASVLGKQQQGAATGRAGENAALVDRDRNALALYQAQQNAQNQGAQTDLDRKKYTDASRGQNAQRAVLAGLLAGGVPHSSVSVAGVPKAQMGEGLLDALARNPQALEALKTLQGQSSEALTAPPSFSGGQILQAPTLSQMPDESGGSKFLSTLARIGELAGAAGKYAPTSPATPPFVPEQEDPAKTDASVYRKVKF